MDQLQLYITISLDTFKHMVDINADSAVKQYVTDVSDALECVDYDPTEKNIFYLLRSTDLGVFVTVLRTIPDKPSHHLAAWIFVPYTISIADMQLAEVVQDVVALVSNSKITNEHMARLNEIFERTYPVIPKPGAMVANIGNQYAHRFYGGSTGYILTDYIGSKRYQTTYLPYSGIILADSEKAPAITGKDLTDEPLEQMVKIFPPQTSDSRYRPLLFGQPFDRPYLVPLMGTIEVIWESPTEVDVCQSIMVSMPNMHPEPIAAATPRVAPAPVTPSPVAPQRAVPDADMPVSKALGAEDDTEETPSSQDEQPKKEASQAEPKRNTASAPERINVYNFEIPSKSAAISGMIHFSISSRSPILDSPIDGYELSDDIQEGASRSNHLIYVPTNGLQNNALWGVGGFIIGILLTLLCTCTFGSSGSAEADGTESADSTEVVAVDTPAPKAEAEAKAEPAAPTDITLAGAVKYLDTNQKWEKRQLESYPDLKGLYDDLNNIDRKKIVEVWGPKLKESRSFGKIVEHAQNSYKKKARLPQGQTTFNTPNDQTITVRSYLNCIDP